MISVRDCWFVHVGHDASFMLVLIMLIMLVLIKKDNSNLYHALALGKPQFFC